jgi:hypothetical protein
LVKVKQSEKNVSLRLMHALNELQHESLHTGSVDIPTRTLWWKKKKKATASVQPN